MAEYKITHASDCAVNNGPAVEAAPYDCDHITLGPVFSSSELNELASHLHMLSDDQALQVVNVISEMLRRVECGRQGLKT